MATGDRQGSVPWVKELKTRGTQAVDVDHAAGLALGPDGRPHPIEVDGDGSLYTTSRSLNSVLEEILRELKALRMGLTMAENSVCDDVDPDELPDDNDAWQ